MKLKLPASFYNTTISTYVFIVFILFSFTICAQENERTARVEIPNSELLHIASTIVGQEYNIYVHLPGNYLDTSKRFPVLYLLDAQWDFPLVSAIYGEQYFDGFVPGMIIIGITWGGKKPNPDSLRARDLTPTNVERLPQSGNAAKFLSFIKSELVPFIESKYRVAKNDRTLMGSSLGGLFTLYTLFNETELFNRYVLTSPALGWDNEVIYKYEKNYASKKNKLPVRLYMGMGELEHGKPGFDKWTAYLTSQKYNELKLQTRILDGIGHSGTKSEGYTRGLQYVFERTAISLAPSILEQYIGIYGDKIKIEIIKENGQLVMKSSGDVKDYIYAETEKDFYVKGDYLFVHFSKDSKGKVESLQLERYGGETYLKKNN